MSKKKLGSVPLSVLDLSTISVGSTPAEAYRNTVELARHAEQWGFNRFWVAEHHSMAPIASAATAVLIGHIGGATSRIRVGSGGIMLPNHAPMVVAEQFGTLEALHPGRIDLGLGRAPGTDPLTARALRRDTATGFPQQVDELLHFFRMPDSPTSRGVRAIPAEGREVPVWLLGSSDFSARLAAERGLPFSFAGHFSPSFTVPAIQTYRENFKPSATLDEPYVMMGLNLVAADTDDRARLLFSSTEQHFLGLVRGAPVQIQPPQDLSAIWTPAERDAVYRSLAGSIVGGPDTIREKLETYLEATQADELMLTQFMYDQGDRLRSHEIVGEFIKEAAHV